MKESQQLQIQINPFRNSISCTHAAKEFGEHPKVMIYADTLTQMMYYEYAIKEDKI